MQVRISKRVNGKTQVMVVPARRLHRAPVLLEGTPGQAFRDAIAAAIADATRSPQLDPAAAPPE